jgi:hypothetical protein
MKLSENLAQLMSYMFHYNRHGSSLLVDPRFHVMVDSLINVFIIIFAKLSSFCLVGEKMMLNLFADKLNWHTG